MTNSRITTRLIITFLAFSFVFLVSGLLAISMGSADTDIKKFLLTLFSGNDSLDPVYSSIIWQIRFPRVLLAGFCGAALSLGGLVFQALLRNPLAEPYILGISGGAAIGAVIGIMIGLSRFPGVNITAFAGSMLTLLAVLLITSGETVLKKDSLILAGVMVNAFCSALIMFLISMTKSTELQNILFWLMGDLSIIDIKQIRILFYVLIPCFIIIFFFSDSMNILLMGKETAETMGVNIKLTVLTLLILTSFMISMTVCYAGLLGFVGLVMPHLLRLCLGSDHRVLVPACIFGGGAYMILCDLIARTLPSNGEIPVGVITAMIGAPLFVVLLRRK